jgi:hypothetical protein
MKFNLLKIPMLDNTLFKAIPVVCVCFAGPLIRAQSINEPSAIVTSGGDASAPDNSSTSYSIGQIDFLFFFEENSGSINQGVQQPFEAIIVSVEKGFNLASVRIFPNPAKDVVNLHVIDESFEPNSHTFRLHDISGKYSIEQTITEPQSIVQVKHLPTGTYFIELINGKKQKAIFKIFKL